MSLLRPILARLITSPKRTAVVDDNTTWSYARLVLGSFFLARLIRRTTDARHVGIMLPTGGAFPMAVLGCWLARRVPVPINYLLNQSEMQHIIDDSEIDTLLTAGKMLEFVGDEVIPSHINKVKLEDEVKNFKGLPPLRWPPKPKDDELAVILYTSGTSGKPKGVELTHRNLESNARSCITHARVTGKYVFLGVLPQFHSFGLTALTLLPLLGGAKVVYTARFIPKKLFKLMRDHRPNVFIAVPSMYGALLNAKDAGPDDVKSIEFAVSGGEPLSASVFDAWHERFNLELCEGYGLTETSPVTNWATPWARKRGSVGQPIPGVRNVIVDDDGNPLGPNREGEVLIVGPNVMRGYHHLPELTDEVMTEVELPDGGRARAFRTGDIGKADEEGFLFITGRKKEMLIIGGENVFPREIEEVLATYEGVSACAVIGKPDDTRGEVPIAFVELEESADRDSFDAGAARDFLRQRLAQFKVPREIRVIEQLPRNPTGKVLRRELRAD
jgi:long-chain acyl-CoA synthetase